MLKTVYVTVIKVLGRVDGRSWPTLNMVHVIKVKGRHVINVLGRGGGRSWSTQTVYINYHQGDGERG